MDDDSSVDSSGHNSAYYLNVYNIISGLSLVCLAIASGMNALSGLEGARVFHERLLHSMFRAPMQCTTRAADCLLVNLLIPLCSLCSL
jgi:hypothetical protein